MSTLQSQVIQSLNGLSDDNLRFLLDMIQRFMRPADSASVLPEKKRRRIGSLEGLNLIDADYDIDECNDEIARMFEEFDI
ncbi:MAG: hypothetical protein HFI31_06310 [Lachnospiraceae bacterium]|jgi:hypothetical protein|nr:hypothetical protein [Lachnospiraceae bacterium]MCI8995834.1 hypothetical protein [Lachnospiraceae bacterium]MCI9133787.1 hypothetical protein [Lachnospiraceae bacterium]